MTGSGLTKRSSMSQNIFFVESFRTGWRNKDGEELHLISWKMKWNCNICRKTNKTWQNETLFWLVSFSTFGKCKFLIPGNQGVEALSCTPPLELSNDFCLHFCLRQHVENSWYLSLSKWLTKVLLDCHLIKLVSFKFLSICLHRKISIWAWDKKVKDYNW